MADPRGWDEVERVAKEAAQGVPMFIVATGARVGHIGSAEDLVGETVLAEGAVYDPAEFPDLARFLAPYYGEHRVPSLSSPAWL